MDEKHDDVPLSDDELREARAAYAKYRYVASGGGQYGQCLNTVAGEFTVDFSQNDELPRVELGPKAAAIVYHGKTYPVSLRAGEALKAIVDAFPRAVGLSAIIGPHPERAINELPEVLLVHIQCLPGNKGYAWKL